MSQSDATGHVHSRRSRTAVLSRLVLETSRHLYKKALQENTALEELADTVANLENLASRRARESKYLRDPLIRFRSELRDLFNTALYPELLQRRAAIEQYEDGLAQDAEHLAPKFAHRVAELKQQFETGGQDHESTNHEGAGTSRVFPGAARRAVSGRR